MSARAGRAHSTDPLMTVTNTHGSGKSPWDITTGILTAQWSCHNVHNTMHHVLAKPLKPVNWHDPGPSGSESHLEG